MNAFDRLAVLIALAAGFMFAAHRGLRYLRMMQQDEYSAGRFWEWFKSRRAADLRGSLVILAAFALSTCSARPSVQLLVSIAAAAALLLFKRHEGDPRTTGKIRLLMTSRAKRIFTIASLCFLLLALLLAAALITAGPSLYSRWLWVVLLVLLQAVPFCLLAAVALLAPGERRLQARFLREAQERVAQIDPFTIGVTGSYGKTSVKNMLGEALLACKGATFWPAKGTNTIMGNTRAIREGLAETHALAVIEMGAYRRGTIARLCELTPPDAGIITAIASMHLERFGSREEIYLAKTELARAVPQQGLLICNADDEFTRRAAKEFPKARTVLYGFAADANCRIASRETTPAGTHFEITREGKVWRGFTQLFGRPALSNIAAVFAAACELGCQPELVLGALSNIKPVDNRLSVQRAGNVIFLNDAYNSNPVGFAAALEVLSEMPAGRRILVTPGMIELGADQERENRSMAERAAKVCAKVLLVGEVNRNAWQAGLREGGLAEEHVLFFPHRDPALAALKALQQDGDAVLIENDLSDWYEDQTRF